jgi:hypothetical protein
VCHFGNRSGEVALVEEKARAGVFDPFVMHVGNTSRELGENSKMVNSGESWETLVHKETAEGWDEDALSLFSDLTSKSLLLYRWFLEAWEDGCLEVSWV